MEVINLEQKLTLEQQVIALNENVLGYYGDKFYEDYNLYFGISDYIFKEIQKEKGEWWGNLESQVRYFIGICIDLGYLPKKLTYIGIKTEGENVEHQFSLTCEDKRIIRSGGNF